MSRLVVTKGGKHVARGHNVLRLDRAYPAYLTQGARRDEVGYEDQWRKRSQ